MDFDFDMMKTLFPQKKPVHKLKWGIPEARISIPVQDPEATVKDVRKQAFFSGGGQFVEEVHFKDYGNNVYAYYIIRTDKRTQDESAYFDGYMLQEEERLGVEVTNAFNFAKDLETMGYQYGFAREIEVWSFRALTRPITVFEITDFGNFMEIALPLTKVAGTREKDEKWLEAFLKKNKVDAQTIIPTDVLTLQLVSMLQQQEPAKK